MQKQQKTAEDNAELLQNSLVRVENMGKNLKKFREDMESWKTPEFQDAEREFEDVAQKMMQEVAVSVPAVTEPENIPVIPILSVPQFSVHPNATTPHSLGILLDTEIQEM